MDYNVLIDLNNKSEEYALDTVAKQANGSIWLKSGKCVMLATVVIDENEFAGGAFLPLHPGKYAELLGEKLDANDDVQVWLVNLALQLLQGV